MVEESGSDVYLIPKRQTDTGRLREAQRKRQAAHLLATMDQAYNEDELRELCLVVDAQYYCLSRRNARYNLNLVANRHRDDIGQVIFTLRIGILELA